MPTTGVPTVAIANPASGPGVAPSAAYTDVIHRMGVAGGKVVGYVSTSYGLRSQAAVEADILAWYTFYPGIDGIFFDEMTTGSLDVAKYQGYVNYTRALDPDAFCVGNPGTTCVEGYVSTADMDVIVTSERNNSLGSLPVWGPAYPDANFSMLVYNVATQAAMEAYVDQMPTKGYGWAYITPDTTPNPWDTLCAYYAAMLTRIMSVS